MRKAPVHRPQPLGRGERAPDFVLPRGDGVRTRLYGLVGGRPTYLVFAGRSDDDTISRLVTNLRPAGDDGPPVHVVRSAESAARQEDFVDATGRIHTAYGVAPDGPPTVVALDPNVRVRATGAAEDGTPPADLVQDAAASAFTDADVTVRHQAPVLLLPDALSAELRQDLIQRWEQGAPVATGVESSHGGARHEQADDLRKRRRDHTVTDPDLLRTLTEHIGRRVMPEVQKAFAYEARRFEGFKIGCYEAQDHGFFEAHRDNLSPATAHRRFALTLNLNDDYDGGELRFPEYGRQRYRPDAGAALVFSGSHLHEVLPVTRGRRLVLLSFLFDGSPAGRG